MSFRVSVLENGERSIFKKNYLTDRTNLKFTDTYLKQEESRDVFQTILHTF